jgi:cystathionine beta-lyase
VFGVVLHARNRSQIAAFFDALRIFGLGYSYGGFESLAIPADPQLKRDVAPGSVEGPLIRLAIGLEPEAELRADLEEALSYQRP